MAQLRITLFGTFAAQCGQEVIDGLGIGKVQELFCYLLLHRKRPSPREALASLLWDQVTTAQSKAYLRRALWKLQSILKAQLPAHDDPVLLAGPEWLQCNPDFDLWVDVDVFEQVFKSVEGITGQQLTAVQAAALEEAVALYEGDLLENYYQEWCLYERERFRHLHLVMLDKVIGYYEGHGAYEQAITFAVRVLMHDRAREHAHRQLMRLMHLSGDRTGALQQYEKCVEALREELDVAPAERTRQLYEQIRSGPSGIVRGAASRLPATPGSLSEPADGTLDDLKAALAQLARAHEQVCRQVEALERQIK